MNKNQTTPKIKSAIVKFNEHGTPVASQFDDVYFSNDDGEAESQYVFIDGNRLSEQFQACKLPEFVIGETGFGTGLNCALAISAFDKFRAKHPDHPLKRLKIISVEKYPLSSEDLRKALALQPTSSQYKQQLMRQYPMHIAGAHRLYFGSSIIDLWLGDAIDSFQSMLPHCANKINAWFLDGFAPSKNADMWSSHLFSLMAALSAPKATVATFTAAGFVRRGLIEAGFAMSKSKGFGRKRDMLVGHFEGTSTNSAVETAAPQCVAVLGGGLAGANAAISLAKRGCKVTLIDKNDLASGASGNPQGGFYPQLHAQISYPSLIQVHGFNFAKTRYLELLEHNCLFDHDFCGVLLMAFADPVVERQNKMRENDCWPNQLIEFVDAQRASRIANVSLETGGVFVRHGGWISPPSLVNALIERAKQLSDVSVITGAHDIDIEPTVDGVTLRFSGCSKSSTRSLPFNSVFDHVVVATGADEHSIESISRLPFGRTRGQVESVPASKESEKLATVLCHKGYFTPTLQGRQALGSTYVRGDTTTDYRKEEALINFETQRKGLRQSPLIESIQHDFKGRAATRMTLPDHQPVFGVIKDPSTFNRVSVLCGFGSRGLTTAPLASELLASELFNEPMPLSSKLVDALHYSRFDKREGKG